MSKPDLFNVVKSVFSAFVGVQSDENRKRDFASGSITSYVVVGIIATFALVIVLAQLASVVSGS